jgi:hypothetical protein
MKQFLVTFETRRPGSIGIFEHSKEYVTMYQSSFSQVEVTREAMRQLHQKGLETRFSLEVLDITEKVTA